MIKQTTPVNKLPPRVVAYRLGMAHLQAMEAHLDRWAAREVAIDYLASIMNDRTDLNSTIAILRAIAREKFQDGIN